MKKRTHKNNDRFVQVQNAITDEMTRFNAAIRNGAIITLKTFSGEYRVKWVDCDFWYHTDGNGGFGQSWAGCNNGKWADLLTQANVCRNPLFA